MDTQNDENISLECTKVEAKLIKAIDRETVHRICSGQVVLSLGIAVKELVENSIDAGATSIEVRLRDHGLTAIEVLDNGSGVEEANFKGLTAKYHTSKITQFCDLESVATFGFRGEALSSLCALSHMTITTRHKTATTATKLELDSFGAITKKSPCAHPIGTVVTMSDLFYSLPVRRKEFQKNIKKEFIKMCQILQGYCLVAAGVRISCVNQTIGTRTIVMSTTGSSKIMDNISSIFGSKQCMDLIEMKRPMEPDESFSKEILDKLNETLTSTTFLDSSLPDIDRIDFNRFRFDGLISTCSHGSGRSSRDRQFIYINSRPCEPKSIIKLINDIYHRYNIHQNPFVFLNIHIERSEVDVNLTPDKRQLLVNDEKVLLLALKKSLLKTFGDIPSTFKVQDFSNKEISNQIKDNVDVSRKAKSKLNTGFQQIMSQSKATGASDNPTQSQDLKRRKSIDEILCRTLKMRKIQDYLTQETKMSNFTERKLNNNDLSESDSETENEHDDKKRETNNTVQLDKIKKDGNPNNDKDDEDSSRSEIAHLTPGKNCLNSASKRQEESPQTSRYALTPDIEHRTICKVRTPQRENELKIEKIQPVIKKSHINHIELPSENDIKASENNVNDVKNESKDDIIIIDSELPMQKSESTSKYTSTISVTLKDIENLMIREQESFDQKKKIKLNRLKFKADINPNKNKIAEDELDREIDKESFSRMEIIGQFNLGFIVVKLDNDLFIIDQHATDEKYNFEKLQETTKLQSQPLVVPQRLELTAINEMILIDNIRMFEMNGFNFDISYTEPVTRRVKLLSKPFSKNWEFGKEDIEELLFMLQDAPSGCMCRPSRVRGMFASRACRKSVMIGTSLSKYDMRRLVDHMGTIDHPWNCPHGRPTMRHLINLAMLDDSDDES